MPRLKMLLNLGTRDAQRLGIDADKARTGDVVSVDDKVGEELLTHGWATDKLDEDRPAPQAAPHNSAGTPSGPTEAEREGKPAPEPAPEKKPR